MGKSEPGEVGVGHLGEGSRHAIDCRACDVAGLGLAEDEGEVEDEFVLIRQA